MHTKSAEKLLLELLQIFNEIINAYMLRCLILWPEKIKDKRVLDKLNSIVFGKIMDMRRVLQQSLRSIHGEQFNSYFIRYALKHPHATKNLYKHQRTFQNLGFEKESKSLIFMMWNILQEIMP